MKKQLWMCLGGMLVWASCQQEEMGMPQLETSNLQVQASIAGGEKAVRSTTTADGTSTFSEGDAIGFFMPYSETQLKWTLQSKIWKADGEAKWKDKVNTYSFCAYYPYAEATASRDAVEMPDLSTQKGTLADLGTHDFLVARCDASYETNKGQVSFTGGSAFQHVYSLVTVTLQKDQEAEKVSLKKEAFEGEGFFDKHQYKFGAQASEDAMVKSGDTASPALTLTYADGVALTVEGDHSAVVLVNPSATEQALRYTATYERDGISYTATTEQIKASFKAGYSYQYKLKLTKEGLTLVGVDINSWTEGEKGDIQVEETPVEP